MLKKLSRASAFACLTLALVGLGGTSVHADDGSDPPPSQPAPETPPPDQPQPESVGICFMPLMNYPQCIQDAKDQVSALQAMADDGLAYDAGEVPTAPTPGDGNMVVLEGANPCPPIYGGPSGDPTHVDLVLYDVHGCPVPLRTGIARGKKKGDFGRLHIQERNASDGRHPSDASAQALWQQALHNSANFLGEDYYCYEKNFSSSGYRQTMWVFVHYNAYRGYPVKGIITAYIVAGYQHCHVVS